MNARVAGTLVVVALLATAGCLGTAPSGDGSPETPTTGTPTPTAPNGGSTPGDSPDGSPDGTPTFEPVQLKDGPKEAPERPDELTESSVREYVRTYEYRYVYNALWYGEGSDVEVDCEVDSVTELEDGYRAVVTCTGYSNTQGTETGTATPTVLHADWFTQTFVYRVTPEETLRRDATDEER